MGIPEGNSVIHQIVSSICGIGKAVFRAAFHHFFIKCHCGNHSGKQSQTSLYRINGIKGQLLILLHILIVSQRNSLHNRKHGHQSPVHTACLSANQLCNVRILLLRHNAASCAVGIVQLHKPVFIAVPDNNFLAETA